MTVLPNRRAGLLSRLARKALPALALAAAAGLAVVATTRAADDAKPAAAEKAGEGKGVAALAKEGYWGEAPQWAEHEKMLGQPAPKLELSDWINGPVTAEQMKGKVVVVDFWAVWCQPCLRAVPHNNEVAKKYADKGVLLVGACGGGGEEAMGERAEKFKMGYPVAKVTKASTDAWKVQWWPTYAVIDRKGTLRAIGIKPDAVEKVVDAILEEQPAEKAK